MRSLSLLPMESPVVAFRTHFFVTRFGHKGWYLYFCDRYAFLSLVVGHGVIIPSSVQWVLLPIECQKVGFLNIYALILEVTVSFFGKNFFLGPTFHILG